VRRVFDTFLFNDELDLLEARLIELDSTVYRHVLVEAPITFQGNPKPLHFLENQERFASWKDKIIHVTADLESCRNCREREDVSRAAIREGLTDLDDDDIFLISDADEIPRADFLQKAPGHRLAMRNHILAVNLLEPGWTAGTTGSFGRDYRETIKHFLDRQAVRDWKLLVRDTGFPFVAGWHFSWLGGPDAIRAKVHSFSHLEWMAPIDAHADRLYADRISPASLGGHLVETVIDGSWPKYMQERRGPAAWYWPGGG
jgi:Glycosyltransferase family 17